MFEQEYLKQISAKGAYEQGKEIFHQRKIRDFEVVKKGSRKVIIRAAVAMNAGNVFHIELTVDTKISEVDEAYCDCSSFDYRAGLCKHCVAVLLAFLEYESGGTALSDPVKVQDSNDRYGSEEAQGRKTSPDMGRFLEKLKNQMIDQEEQKEIDSGCSTNVRLKPHLRFREDTITLFFTLENGQSYVLKDIFGFENRMQKEEFYEYGKALAFAHREEAFAEESLPVLNYLMNWVRLNRPKFRGVTGQDTISLYPEQKEILLTLAEAEEFLEQMGNMEIPAVIASYGEKETIWKAAEGCPDYRFHILGSEDGIEVSIADIFEFSGRSFRITFTDGHIFFVPEKKWESLRGFMDCLKREKDHKIFLSRKDVPFFVRQILPECKKRMEVTTENFDPEKYGVWPAVFSFYLDARNRNTIEIKAMAAYGEQTVNVMDQGWNDPIRDQIRERKIERIVRRYSTACDSDRKTGILSGDEDLLYEFLTKGISALEKEGEVYISESMKKLRVQSGPKISVGISSKGNLLELKVKSDTLKKEDMNRILSQYSGDKNYIRLEDGGFLDLKNSGLETLLRFRDTSQKETKEPLEVNDKGETTFRIPRFRAMYLDEELKSQEMISIERDKAFRSMIRTMKSTEDMDYEVPDTLKPILRDYQKTGYYWIRTLFEYRLGGVLADDMGLGKTLQVITFLLSCYEEGEGTMTRSLVVCPASLVYNWKSELKKFAPELPVRLVIGSAEERKRILEEAAGNEVLVTSYDLLRRDVEWYRKLEFLNEILDEGQYIKNPGTQITSAVKEISAQFRLVMSGTPIENRLGELWSIFDFILPGFLYDYRLFRSAFELPIIQYKDADASAQLGTMVRPFILRRLKKDVLKELPEKTEEIIYADMDESQRMLYDAHVLLLQKLLDEGTEDSFYRERIKVLSELTRLRQICCDPVLVDPSYQGASAKAEECMELIEKAIHGGHRILLFSQFTSMLDRIIGMLKERGIGCHLLTGDLSKEKRRREVEEFKKDDCPVFCISLKAGGTGLNLTEADIVIHYDPWWNLAVQNQATDRVYRMGQKNPVTVYRLIVKDTVEDNILQMQNRKKELADLILSGEDFGKGIITKEDIRALLS